MEGLEIVDQEVLSGEFCPQPGTFSTFQHSIVGQFAPSNIFLPQSSFPLAFDNVPFSVPHPRLSQGVIAQSKPSPAYQPSQAPTWWDFLTPRPSIVTENRLGR